MTDDDRLTTRQRRFIAALASTPTVRDAAALADVSEPTAWRYLADPAVKAEIAKRQDAMLAQTTAGLVRDMALARAVLIELVKAPETADGTRCRAALGILDCGLRLFEMLTLADRVAELERRVSEQTQDR